MNDIYRGLEVDGKTIVFLVGNKGDGFGITAVHPDPQGYLIFSHLTGRWDKQNAALREIETNWETLLEQVPK